ncbi:MAG: Rrf2 family transcriptional regulator [Chitinispirillaceae bacterium]|nr:Rrf2 family transcriptional regulator [Chitinispirillaceae bacterium]
MKLPTRCRYGVRAMIEVACRHEAGAVKCREISGRHGISQACLENILSALKSARLISTIRGAQGLGEAASGPGTGSGIFFACGSCRNGKTIAGH